MSWTKKHRQRYRDRPRRIKNPPLGLPLSEQRKNQIIEMVQTEGISEYKVAEFFGVSRRTVRKLLGKVSNKFD